MSKQTINIGASPNDGTGTPLRTSFDYTNQNFTEIYTALGGGVALPGATTQVIFNDGGTNLAGDAGLVYNKTTDALTVAGLVTAGSATITGALTVGTTTLVANAAGYTGKVGIGTATPTSDLDIFRASGSGITSGISLRTAAGAGGDGSFIKWLSGGSAEKVAQIDGVLNGTDVGYLSFQCGNGADAMAEQYRIASSGVFSWFDGAGGTRMTLNSTGLGVGRSPAYKLDVSSATASNQLRLSGSNQNTMVFANAAAGASNGFLVGRSWASDDANNWFIYDVTASALRLFIGGTGNIGIGTASPTEVLHVTSGNVKLDNGNVILGTSGKGIDFSATADGAGRTSELLNDYEEGTWVPTQGSGLTVVGTFSSAGTYTKVGRLVTIAGSVNGSTSIATAAAGFMCAGLPFASSQQNVGGAVNSATTVGAQCIINVTDFYSITAIGATTSIRFSATYQV